MKSYILMESSVVNLLMLLMLFILFVLILVSLISNLFICHRFNTLLVVPPISVQISGSGITPPTAGQNYTITSNVSGIYTSTYQWRKNDTYSAIWNRINSLLLSTHTLKCWTVLFVESLLILGHWFNDSVTVTVKSEKLCSQLVYHCINFLIDPVPAPTSLSFTSNISNPIWPIGTDVHDSYLHCGIESSCWCLSDCKY